MGTKWRAGACAALAASLALVCPASARADDSPAGPKGSLTEKRLDNGMKVIVQEDHRVPLVALALRYDVGERAAPPGLAGIAALTTFLMLNGTKHVPPGDYRRLLAGAGAFTVADTTWEDATVLEVELPSNRLELPLWLWSDQMGFFDDGLDDTALELQRSVLEKQRRTWLGTTPFARVSAIADEEIFPLDHPYRNAIPGTPEDLQKIDRNAVLAFHKAWITPEHATLSIVGDVLPADALAMAQRYFGTIPSGTPGQIRRPPPVLLKGQTIVDMAANVPVARASIYWPTARFLTSEDAQLDIVSHVLSGRRTAWLYWILVDEKKVATRVWVKQHSHDLGSELEVTIEGAPGRSAAELLAAFDAAMGVLATRPASQGVIGMAGYEEVMGQAVELENPRTRARSFVSYSALVGTPYYGPHDLGRYGQITPDDIPQAIAKWMPSDRRVVLLVSPERGAPMAGERRGRRFVPGGSP
jgi:zinc protease